MSPELDEFLCKRFPNLYADRHADMRTTCMCWGFEVGDGWFLILLSLSEDLEKMILALPEEGRQHCKASQCKQKFGTLRCYLTASTKEMDERIRKAGEQTSKTCEDCGQPGTLKTIRGWMSVTCEEHAKK
jgi:hypothetical protein